MDGTQKDVEACKVLPYEIKREIMQICSRLQENMIKKIETKVEEEKSNVESKWLVRTLETYLRKCVSAHKLT